MKTHKRLFEQTTSFENLFCAIKKASKGKRKKGNVLRCIFNLENEMMQLRNELVQKTYKPGGYHCFHIRDPKPRHISAAPFRDRVVHHALCNVIEPLFEETFIFDSYANRIGKGTHSAIRRAQRFLRKNRYVLKCDIYKYFASVDHEILKQEIRRKIADTDLLWLVDTIIDGSNQQEFVNETFPGDTLLTPLERRKGLPLGNLTSQFFGNMYLNRFDHFVKEKLKSKYYVRYVDDFLIAGDSADCLNKMKERIEEYLFRFRLRLHPKKCHVLKSEQGVPFLGQVIYPDYRLLKKDNVRRFCKRISKMREPLHYYRCGADFFVRSIQGWNGHARQADTFKLRRVLENKFSDLHINLTDSDYPIILRGKHE